MLNVTTAYLASLSHCLTKLRIRMSFVFFFTRQLKLDSESASQIYVSDFNMTSASSDGVAASPVDAVTNVTHVAMLLNTSDVYWNLPSRLSVGSKVSVHFETLPLTMILFLNMWSAGGGRMVKGGRRKQFLDEAISLASASHCLWSLLKVVFTIFLCAFSFALIF